MERSLKTKRSREYWRFVDRVCASGPNVKIIYRDKEDRRVVEAEED